MASKPEASPDLRRVLARNLRRLRTAGHLSQDAVAEDARYVGLAWHRTTVADLEVGRRALTAEELALLPALLGAELVDLFHHPGPGIRIGDFEIRSEDVAKLISGKASEVRLPRIVRGGPVTLRPSQYLRDRARQEGERLVKREAESHAAKVLDRDPFEVLEACFRLWDRPLTEERERRLEKEPKTGDLAQRRGWITRRLIGELKDYFGGIEK